MQINPQSLMSKVPEKKNKKRISKNLAAINFVVISIFNYFNNS